MQTLTGRALLATVPMPTQATFTYFAQGDGGAAMPSPFTLDVAYMSGALVCTPHRDPPPGSAAPSLPASISIAVSVGFRTSDGMFAETALAGTLSGTAASLSLVASEPAASVKGTYKPMLATVTVTGNFGGTAPNGNVSQGGGNSTVPVGQWK
jgi:hypothetical protein